VFARVRRSLHVDVFAGVRDQRCTVLPNRCAQVYERHKLREAATNVNDLYQLALKHPATGCAPYIATLTSLTSSLFILYHQPHAGVNFAANTYLLWAVMRFSTICAPCLAGTLLAGILLVYTRRVRAALLSLILFGKISLRPIQVLSDMFDEFKSAAGTIDSDVVVTKPHGAFSTA